MRVLILLFLLLPLSIGAAEPTFLEQQERMSRIDNFVWDGPEFLAKPTVERIRSLDRIAKEVTQKAPNPYSKDTILFTTLTFEHGLEIAYRTFGKPLQLGLIQVVISSPRWPVKHGLNVGAPIARVTEILGEPFHTSATQLFYKGETEEAIFTFKNGLINSVDLGYYAD